MPFTISKIWITPRIPDTQNVNPSVQEVAAIQATGATFQINNFKSYVPAASLSMNDNISFLENVK